MNREKMKTGERLAVSIVTIVVLTLCLCITTYALVRETITIEDHYFHSGTIDINLNDGKAIIEEHEFNFEPGMTVKKDFFIENRSTWEVYYKIYMNNVEGDLADVLEIKIQDKEKVLFSGTAAELSRVNVQAADDALGVQEKRVLSIYFHFPEDAGNSTQNQTLTFDLCADAVQTKNNPNKLFE